MFFLLSPFAPLVPLPHGNDDGDEAGNNPNPYPRHLRRGQSLRLVTYRVFERRRKITVSFNMLWEPWG